MKHGQAPCHHILTLKVLKPIIKVIFICHLYSNIKQPNFTRFIFLGNKATEKQKIPQRRPNTCRIFKACRERSKNLKRMWFQKIWETGIVLSLWKKAIVVPILKAGKVCTSTTSHMPISLTSNDGKIYGKNN